MPYYSKTKIKRALTVTIAYKIDEQSMGVRMFVVLVEDDPYIAHSICAALDFLNICSSVSLRLFLTISYFHFILFHFYLFL